MVIFENLHKIRIQRFNGLREKKSSRVKLFNHGTCIFALISTNVKYKTFWVQICVMSVSDILSVSCPECTAAFPVICSPRVYTRLLSFCFLLRKLGIKFRKVPIGAWHIYASKFGINFFGQRFDTFISCHYKIIIGFSTLGGFKFNLCVLCTMLLW